MHFPLRGRSLTTYVDKMRLVGGAGNIDPVQIFHITFTVKKFLYKCHLGIGNGQNLLNVIKERFLSGNHNISIFLVHF